MCLTDAVTMPGHTRFSTKLKWSGYSQNYLKLMTHQCGNLQDLFRKAKQAIRSNLASVVKNLAPIVTAYWLQSASCSSYISSPILAPRMSSEHFGFTIL